MQQVRKVEKSAVTKTGRFHSVKNLGEIIKYEGVLVRELLCMLEMDPDVKTFRTEPVQIPYRNEKKKACVYTPDLTVEFRGPCRFSKTGKRMLIEVKQQNEVERFGDKHEQKYAAVEAYAKDRGMEFHLFTELRIGGPFLRNARFLRFARRILPLEKDIDHTMATLKRLGRTSVDNLLERINGKKEIDRRHRFISCIWYLVANHTIKADWDKPLTVLSDVSVK